MFLSNFPPYICSGKIEYQYGHLSDYQLLLFQHHGGGSYLLTYLFEKIIYNYSDSFHRHRLSLRDQRVYLSHHPHCLHPYHRRLLLHCPMNQHPTLYTRTSHSMTFSMLIGERHPIVISKTPPGYLNIPIINVSWSMKTLICLRMSFFPFFFPASFIRPSLVTLICMLNSGWTVISRCYLTVE